MKTRKTIAFTVDAIQQRALLSTRVYSCASAHVHVFARACISPTRITHPSSAIRIICRADALFLSLSLSLSLAFALSSIAFSPVMSKRPSLAISRSLNTSVSSELSARITALLRYCSREIIRAISLRSKWRIGLSIDAREERNAIHRRIRCFMCDLSR